MKREELEVAIHNLVQLLDSGEERESAFQRYFEEHQCVFQLMNFVKAYPRPQLPLVGLSAKRKYLEPDFLLERFDGLFEIAELKTPQEKVLREIAYREKFYSKIQEYISQVANYSEYFDDSHHRELVREQLSLDVQSRPDATLIVGRDEGLDKKLLHKMLARHAMRVRVNTFDDVLTQIRMHYAQNFGQGDGLPGVALYGAIRVERGDTEKRRYVFDQGLSSSNNRFSIILSGDSLWFEVWDCNGQRYQIGSVLPDSVLGGIEILFVSAYFGTGPNETFLQLRFQNTIVAEQVVAKSVMLDTNVAAAVATLGQDIEGAHSVGTTFYMYRWIQYGTIQSVDDRMSLVAHFMDRVVNKKYRRSLKFEDGQCLKKDSCTGPLSIG